ncbi:SIR2 family protein [Geodermatophilus sp. SYSU D01036]
MTADHVASWPTLGYDLWVPPRSLISYLPRPLLDDLVSGRWLPIIGAGMSRNAVLPGVTGGLPDWKGLAKEIEKELPPEYIGDTPIENLSAYEHAYGRAKLIQRVMKALRVRDASPGRVHEAFCNIPFDAVVTTNVEQLLESAYRAHHGDVLAITEEQQLRLSNPYDTPTLLKLHGDLHHPSSLVLTERDYDEFAIRNPLFVTWLAHQLIVRTGVLIGYSLEDADFRQVLSIIRSRLGNASLDLYVIEVGADPAKVDRFSRRGVRVINLPHGRAGYGVLANLFDELYEYWKLNLPTRLQGATAPVRALLRAGRRTDSTVLFLVPDSMMGIYDDFVFPKVADEGLLPITRQDVTHPSGYRVASTDALLGISGQVVVHTDQPTDPLLQKALAAVGHGDVLVVGKLLRKLGFKVLSPPEPHDLEAWDAFGAHLAGQLRSEESRIDEELSTDDTSPRDLRSTAILAVVELERILRATSPNATFNTPAARGGRTKAATLRQLLQYAQGRIELALSPVDIDFLVDCRNRLLHGIAIDDLDALQRCIKLSNALIESLREAL